MHIIQFDLSTDHDIQTQHMGIYYVLDKLACFAPSANHCPPLTIRGPPMAGHGTLGVQVSVAIPCLGKAGNMFCNCGYGAN